MACHMNVDKTFRLDVRTWLLLLSVVTTLPVVLFSIFTVHALGRSQQDALLSSLEQRTQAAAKALAQHLETYAACS